jgi:hypothetical protein
MEHTLSIYNDEADVTHQLGQEGLIRVYNNSGATITDGQPVYVTGNEGTEFRPTIALAQANTRLTSEVIGFSTHDIENNSFGYVTFWGLINNLDTSSFTDGDPLYLGEGSPGELVTTPPSATGSYTVFLGYVIRAHASAGRILTILGPDLGLPSSDAEELVLEVTKDSAGTINPGEVVRLVGFNVGQDRPSVELADASAAGTMPAIGVARDSFTNSTSGFIVIAGRLTNQDTSGFSVTDELYVSETAGQLTNVKPTGTALIQKIAQVLRSNVSSGALEVFGAGRSNDLPNLTSGNVWLGNGSGVPTETSRSGIDDTAIHDNVAGEIAGLTQKVTPVGADHLLIEDSADSNNKKRALLSSLPGGGDVTAAANIADNRVVRGDGGAKGIQQSGVILNDTDQMSAIETATFNTEHDNGSQGASWTLDWNNGQKQKVTLTASTTTLTITAPPGPGNFLLKVIQGGAGSFEITWPAAVLWPNGNAPNFTNAAASVDIVTFYYDGTNYYGVANFDFQ